VIRKGPYNAPSQGGVGRVFKTVFFKNPGC
jgi:hypothetical protein